MLPRWRRATGARLWVSPRRLRRIQACRRESAQVAVTVLLVRLVEHPTGLGCLWLLVFTFGAVNGRLLRWRPSRDRSVEKAAVEKATGGASVHTGGASTVSTVLWESRADVDDRAGSDGDGKVDAAGGAAATIGSMQVEEEEIEATDP